MTTATNYVDKIVHVENKGGLLSSPAHVRLLVAVPASVDNTTDASKNYIHWNQGNRVDLKGEGAYNNMTAATSVDQNSWDWNTADEFLGLTIDNILYNVYVVYNKDVLKPGESTSAALSGFYMDTNVDWDDETKSYVLVNEDGSETQIDIPDEVDILVCAQAVQASVSEDPAIAFANSTFGMLNGDNIVKWLSEVEVPVLVSSADELKDALAEGGSVVLTESVTLEEESTVIDNDATIILSNGAAITAERTGSSAKESSVMTITGNVILGGDGLVENTKEYAITLGQESADGSSLIINDGTYKGVVTAINVVKGDLTINGGFFEVGESKWGSTFLINCIDENYKNDTANVTITGGTFVNWDPAGNASENPAANFVAPGYTVVKQVQTNNDIWYTVVAE